MPLLPPQVKQSNLHIYKECNSGTPWSKQSVAFSYSFFQEILLKNKYAQRKAILGGSISGIAMLCGKSG